MVYVFYHSCDGCGKKIEERLKDWYGLETHESHRCFENYADKKVKHYCSITCLTKAIRPKKKRKNTRVCEVIEAAVWDDGMGGGKK